jgi:plastocyanin
MSQWNNRFGTLASLSILFSVFLLVFTTMSLANEGRHESSKSSDAMQGKMQGQHQMPMPMMSDSADGGSGHGGNLAKAQACRRELLDGNSMMDEHQTQDCIDLVSRFEGAGSGKVVTVTMVTDSQGRNIYEPARVEIDRGDTVKWINVSGVHNTAAYPNRIPRDAFPWEAPLLTQEGQSYARTFFNVGTHAYHCHPHEAVGMKGVVIVERESRSGEFRQLRGGEEDHAHH